MHLPLGGPSPLDGRQLFARQIGDQQQTSTQSDNSSNGGKTFIIVRLQLLYTIAPFVIDIAQPRVKQFFLLQSSRLHSLTTSLLIGRSRHCHCPLHHHNLLPHLKFLALKTRPRTKEHTEHQHHQLNMAALEARQAQHGRLQPLTTAPGLRRPLFISRINRCSRKQDNTRPGERINRALWQHGSRSKCQHKQRTNRHRRRPQHIRSQRDDPPTLLLHTQCL